MNVFLPLCMAAVLVFLLWVSDVQDKTIQEQAKEIQGLAEFMAEQQALLAKPCEERNVVPNPYHEKQRETLTAKK